MSTANQTNEEKMSKAKKLKNKRPKGLRGRNRKTVGRRLTIKQNKLNAVLPTWGEKIKPFLDGKCCKIGVALLTFDFEALHPFFSASWQRREARCSFYPPTPVPAAHMSWAWITNKTTINSQNPQQTISKIRWFSQSLKRNSKHFLRLHFLRLIAYSTHCTCKLNQRKSPNSRKISTIYQSIPLCSKSEIRFWLTKNK